MVCYPPQEGWEDTDNRSKNLPRMFPFRSAIKRGLVRFFDALFFLFVYISFLSLSLFFPTPSSPQHKKGADFVRHARRRSEEGGVFVNSLLSKRLFLFFFFFFRRYFERYSHFLSVCEYESGSWECLDRNKMKKKRNNTGLLGKVQWNTIWEINKFSADILK